MKKLFVLLLILSFRKNFGQQLLWIPDVNFRTYLQNTIPGAMVGTSLNVTSTLVTGFNTPMDVGSLGISSLYGIQYFSSLSVLFCRDNFLVGLPPLPNSLQYLYCNNNHLTSLPPLPNSLKSLACWSNNLSSLPSLPNSLTYLGCAYNHLTGLPALPGSLEQVWCNNNSLTNIPPLPDELYALLCGDNSITSLPLLPASLQQLQCYNNSLTSLPSLPLSLKSLLCDQNNIICFPPFNDSLQFVSISQNPFTCLPNFVLPAMNQYTATPICAIGNSNGCAVVGINEINSDANQISIFPNPTTGKFNIEAATTEKQSVELFDLNGRSLFSQNIFGKTTIDVTFLKEGVYSLSIKVGDNVTNKKLIIVGL
jgi:Leucine-rich repeat (LRR) protein